MPLIPDFKHPEGQHIPSTPSVSAAMAPGRGLMNLGEGITRVGQDIGEEQLRRQRATDEASLSQASLDMQAAENDILEFQTKNPDESTWEPYRSQRISQVNEKIAGMKVSPDGRQRMDLQTRQWNEESRHRVTFAGLQQKSRRERQVTTNVVEQMKRAKNWSGARERLEASRHIIFHSDEVDADLAALDAEEKESIKNDAHSSRMAAIETDPFSQAANYASPTAPQGRNQEEYTLERDHYHRRRTISQHQLLDTLRGSIGKTITRPEQLEEYKDELGEDAVKDLQTRMGRVLKADEKRFLDSPAGQEHLVGKIAYDIKHLERDDTRGRIAIEGMLDDVHESGQKKDLASELDDKVNGTVKPVTAASEAFKALDDYDERLARKLPQAQRMTTREIVDRGFFKDVAKMISLGFSEAQAKQIRQSAEKSNGEGQAMFRQLWEWRPSGSVDAERTAVLAAEALRNDSPTIEVFTAESEAAARTAEEEFYRGKGERRTKLTAFLQAHPKATVTEIQAKINELADGQASASLKAKVIPARPVRAGSGPKGAADSTPSSPVGKDLISIVKNFEAGGAPGGFHARAYEDYGQWSIGYGTKSRKGETIDEAEATRRLETELASHRARVEKEAKRVGMTFTANEMDALTSFDFNTGSIGQLLAGGKRSKAEIAEKMLLYKKADGQVLPGLENRRKAEQELFLR